MEQRDEHGDKRKAPLLYLVRETKDIGLPGSPGSMRDNERRKVDCGKQHFKAALKVNYKPVTDWKSVIS